MMSKSRFWRVLFAALLVLSAGGVTSLGCANGWWTAEESHAADPKARPPTVREPDAETLREPIQPIAPPSPEKAAKVTLGGRLFFERRLSRNDTVACSDCHDLEHGGADHRRFAVGIDQHVGAINTPTVFNAGLNPRQFWDGRADSLEAQIDGPLQHADEMGGSWSAAVAKLESDPSYVEAFTHAFGKPEISSTTIKDAIASYERTLVLTESRFDGYLQGDKAALSGEERDGYELFKSYGCISCHQGRNVGGNMFETMGVMGDYFADRGGEITKADLGRYNVTQRLEDKYRFRVPSLRTAILTPPYFHDGSVSTLEEAVRLMAKYQLGTTMPASDEEAIVKFLRTLPGSYHPAIADTHVATSVAKDVHVEAP